MTKTWKNKVLDYYNTFKSMDDMDAEKCTDYFWKKFGPTSDSKDKWGKVFYHFYDSLTTKCVNFTETDGMCSYCWDMYHDTVEMLKEGDYYDGLEKKHLDYFMKITKEGVDNDNIQRVNIQSDS